jgi:TetR/AcrR family transcriptional regulator
VKAVATISHRLAANDRRRQLLDTALDIFSRKGFDGATTKEIATAAGVTEAIIFRHFPSKQALYAAVIDDHHTNDQFVECMAEWQDCMDRNDDEGLVRSIIERIIESHRCDTRMHRLLLYAALEGHEAGLAHNRQIVTPVAEMLFGYAERGRDDRMRPLLHHRGGSGCGQTLWHDDGNVRISGRTQE